MDVVVVMMVVVKLVVEKTKMAVVFQWSMQVEGEREGN